MAIGNPITLTNNVASKSISVTATADQTLFTVTGGYRINKLAVFRNGVRLTDGVDFLARDGASVTLTTAANLNDGIDFQVFDDFRVADAIGIDGGTSFGNVIVGTGITLFATSGIVSATSFFGDASNLTNLPSSGVGTTGSVNTSGIITATSFNTSSSTGISTVGILTAYGSITATTSLVGALTGNADTATTATNVTVADESTDTTCFPLFTTGATGNLPPKSGTNLTFNSSTGALSATSFSGNLTGTATTATNLASAANITTGTIADARFPATLPALNGSALTNLTAGNLTGALPAISGASLTNLPASGDSNDITACLFI